MGAISSKRPHVGCLGLCLVETYVATNHAYARGLLEKRGRRNTTTCSANSQMVVCGHDCGCAIICETTKKEEDESSQSWSSCSCPHCMLKPGIVLPRPGTT